MSRTTTFLQDISSDKHPFVSRPASPLLSNAVQFRYLFRSHLKATILVVAILFFVVLLIQISHFARLVDGTISSIFDVLLISLAQSLTLVQSIFPYVVMISTAGSLYRLNQRFELAMMFQSGRSPLQIIVPILACTMIVGVVLTAVVNPVSTWVYSQGEDIKHKLKHNREKIAPTEYPIEIITRSSNTMTMAVVDIVADDGTSLRGITLFQFDKNYNLIDRSDIPAAHWNSESGKFESNQPTFNKSLAAMDTRPELLREQFGNINSMSVFELPRKIRIAESLGKSNLHLKHHFEKLIMLPFLLTAIALLTASLAIKPHTQTKTEALVLSVTLVVFLYYTVSTVAGSLTSAGTISSTLANVSIPLLVALVGLVSLFYNTEIV
ncbi:MAG: LptF/LptG family permease [Pseudomonadota bacterium]